MRPSIRAIAVDYDGTIAEHDRPHPRALEALASIRAGGTRVVLATGRIFAELLEVFPDVLSCFDAVVAENGGVMVLADGKPRALSQPVSAVLVADLRRRMVPFRCGTVLVATQVSQSQTIVDAIGRLGIDEQILRNRDELMILPARVSKGSGVDEAFAELGVSHHSAIGIGDAENDHALLSACEVGVAVGNAVPALRARADIVIAEPGPEALARWLEDASAEKIPITSRRRVALGVWSSGAPALVPASMSNVFIVGKSGSGKSYLAGLFAERLVRAGYSICMFDPEGDYSQLGELRGVVTVGGTHPPPTVEELVPLLRHRFGSVVVDLSLQPVSDRIDYMRRALRHLAAYRGRSGLPHWIFIDEAHVALQDDDDLSDLYRQKGICLVTYHPDELGTLTRSASDIGIFLAGSDEFARDAASSNAERGSELAARINRLEEHSALLVDLGAPGLPCREFKLDSRVSAHVRHRHKYANGSLSSAQCFEFRDEAGRILGRSAGNVAELEQQIATAPLGSIAHHVRSRDFSRWAEGALQDQLLARRLAQVEREEAGDTENTRHALLLAIHDRYTASELAS